MTDHLSRGMRVALLGVALLGVCGSGWLLLPREGDPGWFAAEPPSTGGAGSGTDKPEVKTTFDAPSLEALAKVKWTPRPVVDFLQILRDHHANGPPPLPDDQVLRTQNVDEISNGKIRAALARLPASDDEVDWDATLNRYLFAEPKNLNPLFQSSGYETQVNALLYAVPFGFDWDLDPLGNSSVIKEWWTSEDRLMDKVVLRDDLTWSDGVPYTARDIEFSFNTIMNPRVPCPSQKVGPDKLKTVKAYDDRTLVFFHREALATNVWNINFPVVARHIYEPLLAQDPTLLQSEAASNINKRPVTSGPYRFSVWNSGQEIVLERRTEWYERQGKLIRPKPFFKTIRFRIIQDRNASMLAFKAGELDEMELSADQWKDHAVGADFYARATKVRGEEWTYSFIAWNQKPIPDAPYFKDPRVREAMSLAFPHEEFLGKICFGLHLPSAGMYHPKSWMGDPSRKPLQQDLRRAQRLLAEAGWRDTDGDRVLDRVIDGQKVDFRFTLSIGSGAPIATKLGLLLKRDLEKLGVECHVKELEGATMMTQNLEHKFHATALVWVTGADPDTARNIWRTEEYVKGRNYIGYSNPKVDELFDKGAREFDRGKRAEIYREIDRLVAADHAYTFLYFRSSFFAVNREIRGINFSPRGPFSFYPGQQSLWKKKRS